MAYFATNIFPADGVRTEWDFSFAGVSPDSASGTLPYLFPQDVRVVEMYRDASGAPAVSERTIELVAPNRVRVVGAPIAAGRQVKIYRQTEDRYPLVDYRDGQTVSDSDLDLASRQALFIAQETQDYASGNIQLDVHDNFNAKDRRIVNLGAGINPTDAVSVKQTWDAVRVPPGEGPIPPLPTAAQRANRVLTFDAAGNPSATGPVAGSAVELALDLANPAKGARMVALPDGGLVSDLPARITASEQLVGDLALPNGATKIGIGETTVASLLRERVSATVYGLSTTGTAEQNRAALQAALNAHRVVFIPAGRFVCYPVFLNSGNTIVGTGASSELFMPADVPRLLPDGTASKPIGLLHVDSMSAASSVNDLVIQNIRLTGDVLLAGFSEFDHLICFNGVNRVHLSNVSLVGFRGDGICLGHGYGDATARFNTYITGEDVDFDGINNNNRNCLSVVSGQHIRFARGTMRNATRGDMPGAVDIEPQNRADACQDIEIRGYRCENIGGTSGVMGVYADTMGVGPEFFTAPITGIRFIDNTIVGCTNRGGAWGVKINRQSGSSVAPRNDVLIRGNFVQDVRMVGNIIGMSGVQHIDNSYDYSADGLHIGQATAGVFDIESTGNYYRRVGYVTGCATWVSTASRVILEDRYDRCGAAGSQYGTITFETGSSDQVRLGDVTITSNLSPKGVSFMTVHTTDIVSNRMGNPRMVELPNEFEDKYIPEEQRVSRTLNALWDRFPHGETVITYPADPIYGRCMVKTVRYYDRTLGTSIHTTYQEMQPDPTGAKAYSILRRRPNPTTGAWQNWREYPGTTVPT